MNEIRLDRIDLNLLVTFDVLMSERSVTRVADKLAQDAVGYQPRSQIGCESSLAITLMVSVWVDRMEPSPFAVKLIDDVRPILSEIKRVVAPRAPFDPSSSTQSFCRAMPDFPGLVSAVIARAQAEAPDVGSTGCR